VARFRDGVSVKILFVTTKSPYPLHEGRALRTYNLIREVAREHEVHLVSFVQTPEELEGIEHMRSLCAEVHFHKLHFNAPKWQLAVEALREPFGRAPLQVVKYRQRAMRSTLRRLLAANRYDLVHFDMLHLADYFALCGDTPKLLTEHNVESVILKRRADTETRPPVRAYLRYQQRKLRRYEARACRAADHVVAVSEADAAQLQDLSGRGVSTVPNGVDTAFFTTASSVQTPAVSASLVYVGAFTWFPNADAIRHFVEQVLPLIRAERPDVTLTVIGKGADPQSEPALAAQPGVRLAGLVDDIRPYVQQAAVYVVPLRIGGGTRLKILDALAMGKAIVSTSIGCEGLAVTPGHDILVADEPQAFAQAVLQLLREPDRAAALGTSGRGLVERRYDWCAIGGALLQAYRQAIDARSQGAGGTAQTTLAAPECRP
jgi:sugar transferase (PEP-CTERM/EpsH1 system associated)